MHSLLERQLKRYLPEVSAEVRATLEPLINAVSSAYEAADDDRALLEHSLLLSSAELRQRYDALQLDISRRIRAESERDAFFRMSADVLCITDATLSVTQVNPSFCRALGLDEKAAVGVNLPSLLHADDRESFIREATSLTAGHVANVAARIQTKAGDYAVISWSLVRDARTQATYVAGRDITEERIEEAKRSQAEKLETVGQLASGVAHEINSPVQFIGDNLSFLRTSLTELEPLFQAVATAIEKPDHTPEIAAMATIAEDIELNYLREELPRSIEESQDGVRRVAELVRALKEFAHPDRPGMTFADINKAIERSVVLVRNETRYVADIQTEFHDVPHIECQLGALNQVFINLIINAAHAIEDRQSKTGNHTKRGTIRLSTRVDSNDLVIAVTDDGCGIPASVREHMFERFFTTKEVGRGTGQGLPLVRSVVQQHHGSLSVESEVGVGTTFFIRLPITQAQRATP